MKRIKHFICEVFKVALLLQFYILYYKNFSLQLSLCHAGTDKSPGFIHYRTETLTR